MPRSNDSSLNQYRQKIGLYTHGNPKHPSWHFSNNKSQSNTYWLTFLACMVLVAQAQAIQGDIRCNRFGEAGSENKIKCSVVPQNAYSDFKKCAEKPYNYGASDGKSYQIIECHGLDNQRTVSSFRCTAIRGAGVSIVKHLNDLLDSCLDEVAPNSPRSEL